MINNKREADNKSKVLKALESFGRLPTSRVAAIVGINTERAKIFLEELLNEKRVIKHEETIATYWETQRGWKTNAK